MAPLTDISGVYKRSTGKIRVTEVPSFIYKGAIDVNSVKINVLPTTSRISQPSVLPPDILEGLIHISTNETPLTQRWNK